MYIFNWPQTTMLKHLAYLPPGLDWKTKPPMYPEAPPSPAHAHSLISIQPNPQPPVTLEIRSVFNLCLLHFTCSFFIGSSCLFIGWVPVFFSESGAAVPCSTKALTTPSWTIHPVYHTSENELEHRERALLIPNILAIRIPTPWMWMRSLRGAFTLTEVKAGSFGKLEGLTRPSFSRGLIKPSLSLLASWVSMESQPEFHKFPFSRQAEVAFLAQNGVLQGLDESVPEEDISCRAGLWRPLMWMRPFLGMVSPSAGQLSRGWMWLSITNRMMPHAAWTLCFQ